MKDFNSLKEAEAHLIAEGWIKPGSSSSIWMHMEKDTLKTIGATKGGAYRIFTSAGLDDSEWVCLDDGSVLEIDGRITPPATIISP